MLYDYSFYILNTICVILYALYYILFNLLIDQKDL